MPSMELCRPRQAALFTSAPAAPRRGRQALAARALFKTKQSATTKEASSSAEQPVGKKVVVPGGFRWDPVMQRWARSKNNEGKAQDVVVQPKSGTAYVVWPVMWDYLQQKRLRSVTNSEARTLMAKGAVLMDVRLPEDYEKQHAVGAVNASMFRRTAGSGPWDQVKKVVMASIAMKATERNPGFLSEALAAVGGNKRKKVIVMCSSGGTLSTVARVESSGKQANDPDKQFGRETRSLKACYELMQAGFSDVVHLEGGLSGWRFDDLPTTSGSA